jgi:hypothetical protein
VAADDDDDEDEVAVVDDDESEEDKKAREKETKKKAAAKAKAALPVNQRVWKLTAEKMRHHVKFAHVDVNPAAKVNKGDNDNAALMTSFGIDSEKLPVVVGFEAVPYDMLGATRPRNILDDECSNVAPPTHGDNKVVDEDAKCSETNRVSTLVASTSVLLDTVDHHAAVQEVTAAGFNDWFKPYALMPRVLLVTNKPKPEDGKVPQMLRALAVEFNEYVSFGISRAIDGGDTSILKYMNVPDGEKLPLLFIVQGVLDKGDTTAGKGEAKVNINVQKLSVQPSFINIARVLDQTRRRFPSLETLKAQEERAQEAEALKEEL